MAFKDYSEFMLPALALPYKGKVYTIDKPSLEIGLRLTRGIADEGGELYSSDVEEQWRLVLGSVYDEMMKDNVPADFVSRCFLTALADFQLGREAAEATWEVGSDPKAFRDWMVAKHPEIAETSTSTDEENSTS